ncbi:hypothetical protein GCM10018952_49990 [Streptosporangium vulgare]
MADVGVVAVSPWRDDVGEILDWSEEMARRPWTPAPADVIPERSWVWRHGAAERPTSDFVPPWSTD